MRGLLAGSSSPRSPRSSTRCRCHLVAAPQPPRAVRIDWAVACRYAESDGQIATLVGAGIDVLNPPALPMMVGVMLVVRLAAAADEFEGGVQHDVTCRVLDPAGAPVLAQDDTPAEAMVMSFAAPEGVQQRVTGWLVHPLFAFQVAWIARESGSYSIETSAGDDTHLSPIHVLPAGA